MSNSGYCIGGRWGWTINITCFNSLQQLCEVAIVTSSFSLFCRLKNAGRERLSKLIKVIYLINYRASFKTRQTKVFLILFSNLGFFEVKYTYYKLQLLMLTVILTGALDIHPNEGIYQEFLVFYCSVVSIRWIP